MARKPSKPRGSAAGSPANGGAGSGGAESGNAPKPATSRAKSVGSTSSPTSSGGAAPKPARPPRREGFLHATGAIGPLAQIERLRTFRPPMRAGDSIASEVERFARDLAKHEHAAGGLARAWASLAPQALQRVTRVDRLHAGVLTIVASDASAMYDAQMWLAEGGLAALRGAAARTLRRVKVTIG